MEEKKSVWPYALRYGTILGLCSVALSIIFYFLFPFDKETMEPKYGWLQWLLSMVLMGIVLFIATKAWRDEEPVQHLTYGQALKFALAVSVPVILISGIYTFIFFKFIEPEFITKIVEKQYQAMADKGMDEEQIEKSMGMMSFMNSPLFYTIFGGLGAFVQVLIAGLVTSIFTRSPEPAVPDQ
jgi:hypothetical protein